MELSERFQGPGFSFRFPDEADLEVRNADTVKYRVRTVDLRGPWKQTPTGEGTRYAVNVLVFERRDGASTGNLLEEAPGPLGTASPDLVEGEFAGRAAHLREGSGPGPRTRAAYFEAAGRFFRVEWRGPARKILDSLEFDEEPETGDEQPETGNEETGTGEG